MWYDYYPFIPPIPNTNEEPPTIYAILNSYCNYDKNEFTSTDYVRPTELAIYGKKAIFDFYYPLTSNVNKDNFEEIILNHYMMRRIGKETLTAFKIALNAKLNEIMPKYNKLFDANINWQIFDDGETTTRSYNESRTDAGNSTNNTQTNATSDRRYSAVPQNEINDIKDGTYMTDYNFDTDASTSNINGSTNNTGNTNISETIKRSPSDKVLIYKDMMELDSIYTRLFKELDKLFYALI